MDLEKTILSIFGVLGLIFVLIIIYYFAARWIDQINTTDKQKIAWPPASYMEASGAQCPDYWVNAGSVGGNKHRCVNKFNLPVIKREQSRCKNVKCKDEGNSKDFTTIKRWPVNNRNEIKDRCLWRDCCVSDKKNKSAAASWIGIDGVCNS